jgi:hypothetical protein
MRTYANREGYELFVAKREFVEWMRNENPAFFKHEITEYFKQYGGTGVEFVKQPSLPSSYSYSYASESGLAGKSLGEYNKADLAASRAAMREPAAERDGPLAWSPRNDNEKKLWIVRLKHAISDAWAYHRGGFEEEWLDLPESYQKDTLRAGIPHLPDAAEKPIVKMGGNARENMSVFIKKCPELTFARLRGAGLVHLITQRAATPLAQLYAADLAHMESAVESAGSADGLERTLTLYLALVPVLEWFYDHFLPHENVNLKRLVAEGPNFAVVSEQRMRELAGEEIAQHKEARQLKQLEFDTKYAPSAKTARPAPAQEAAAVPALAPVPEIVADEVEDTYIPMAAIVGMQRGGGRGWQLAEQVTGERTTASVEIEVGMAVYIWSALRHIW